MVVVAASVTIYVSVALAVPVDVVDKVFYFACPDVCYENSLVRVHKRMGLSCFLMRFLNTSAFTFFRKESPICHSFFGISSSFHLWRTSWYLGFRACSFSCVAWSFGKRKETESSLLSYQQENPSQLKYLNKDSQTLSLDSRKRKNSIFVVDLPTCISVGM